MKILLFILKIIQSLLKVKNSETFLLMNLNGKEKILKESGLLGPKVPPNAISLLILLNNAKGFLLYKTLLLQVSMKQSLVESLQVNRSEESYSALLMPLFILTLCTEEVHK